VVALEAERVADTAVGAVVSGGEKVAGTLKPSGARRRRAERRRGSSAAGHDNLGRSSGVVRPPASRRSGLACASAIRRCGRFGVTAVTRSARQKTARRDVERRFEDVQESAEDLLRGARQRAHSIARLHLSV
jgi:hypothetical protein